MGTKICDQNSVLKYSKQMETDVTLAAVSLQSHSPFSADRFSNDLR